VDAARPFAFPHRPHVEDEGLECGDCHGQWEESEDPGRPLAAQCALCHAELDAEKPPGLRFDALFEGERFRVTAAGRQAEEILFSHRDHARRAGDCNACHAVVAADEGRLGELSADVRLSMERCLACHAAGGGPGREDCAACHAERRAERAPPSHRADWTRFHGTLVRARPEARAEQCGLCHRPASCESCHQLELPASHTNYWRRRAHGIEASLDRTRCATCHDTDACQRCHEEVRPSNHAGSWGSPRNRHCLSCHEPLRGESCGVCHGDAGSHVLATPLPADHLPGMDCRQCHGNGQPLPHVDNGQLCTSCHR
jgi:hypothetical protein